MLFEEPDTLQTVFDFCELSADRADVTTIVDQHEFAQMKARSQVGDSRARASQCHLVREAGRRIRRAGALLLGPRLTQQIQDRRPGDEEG